MLNALLRCPPLHSGMTHPSVLNLGTVLSNTRRMLRYAGSTARWKTIQSATLSHSPALTYEEKSSSQYSIDQWQLPQPGKLHVQAVSSSSSEWVLLIVSVLLSGTGFEKASYMMALCLKRGSELSPER